MKITIASSLFLLFILFSAFTQRPEADKIEDHYPNAKEVGAEIVLDLEEHDYGGKLYTCRDPEGFLWNFGSYNPCE